MAEEDRTEKITTDCDRYNLKQTFGSDVFVAARSKLIQSFLDKRTALKLPNPAGDLGSELISNALAQLAVCDRN
jgi:hypothetical protein